MQKKGASNHYVVLMKIQLSMIEKKECARHVRKECITVKKFKNAEVRRVYT